MKKFILNVAFLLLSSVFYCQAPSLAWVKSYGGNSTESIATAFATDNAGNVYTAGSFVGTVDFDPGAGTAMLTSNGQDDIYVLKLNSSGNYVWSAKIGGANAEWGASMCVDNAGNTYVCGNFRGTIDFDPGPGVYNLTSPSPTLNCMFVFKLDANGVLQWAKQFDSNVSAGPSPRFMRADAAGNVVVNGEFFGTKDFDPGIGTAQLTTTVLSAFIVKLDASGNYVWANNYGACTIVGMDVDASGTIYAGGIFFNTNDFDPSAGVSNLISVGNNDAFLLKLTAAGSLIWARQFGGPQTDAVVAIKADNAGNVYCGGSHEAGFMPNLPSTLTVLPSQGFTDVFIIKLDGSGNTLWSRTVGGLQSEHLTAICVDAANNVYYTGSFAGGALSGSFADFDPGPGTYTLMQVGANDLYYSKLSSSGNFVWAYAAGSSGGETGRGIYVDAAFNLYVNTEFQNTVDFDPFATVLNISSQGGFDAAVLKFSQPDALIPYNTTAPGIGGMQVCSGGTASLSASGQGTITWYASSTSTLGLASGGAFTTPQLTTTTSFYVGAVNNGTESPRTEITVTVLPLPAVTIVASKSVACAGNTISLTAGGASSYQWNTGSTLPVLNYTASATTATYTVTGTGANTCKKSVNISIPSSQCTGVSLHSISASVYQVYPNPATDVFYINGPTATTFVVRNVLGMTVQILEHRGNGPSQVNNLASGIYFVWDSQTDMLAGKIVVKN